MKYDKELTEEICKNIRLGVLNKDAALLAGISEETFYNWQRKENSDGTPNERFHSEFSVSIKKAEAERRRNFILQISKASEKTWQAAAWYLERTEPDNFGRHREMEVKGDGEIIVTIKDYE